MFEVWCSQCNEAHHPGAAPSHSTQKNIVPGKQIWIPKSAQETTGKDQQKYKGKAGVKKKQKGRFPGVSSSMGTRRATQVVRKNKSIKPEPTEPWELATVLSRYGSVVTVGTNEAVRRLMVIDLDSLSLKKCLPANDTVVKDMTELHYTHQPGILHNLRQLFARKQPYSFVGSVLVSINPLQDIPEPELFSGGDNETGELTDEPHPKTIAEKAFRRMAFGIAQSKREQLLNSDPTKTPEASTKINQSILIAGESGAGKSENAKRVLSQLVGREGFSSLSDYDYSASFVSEGVSSTDFAAVQDFQDRLIGSDPILESFGNASTTRNPNSSRFGKFLRLHYEPSADAPAEPLLFGAQITTYLLEKSRVTFQETGERNYRVFYQLLTSPYKLLQRHLGFAQAGYVFNYLGGRRFGKEDQDRVGYVELRTALKMANLEDSTLRIFQIVAAVLHLGNLQIVESAIDADSSQIEDPAADDRDPQARQSLRPSIAGSVNTQMLDRLELDDNMDLSEEAFAKREQSMAAVQPVLDFNPDYSPLNFASRLLGLKPAALTQFLTIKKMNFNGKNMEKALTRRDAELRRDALSKHIYSLLFDWIVQQLNLELEGEAECTDKSECTFIGVLDVFGFEKFAKNGLEQLLINFANEKLLALFTREILVGEREVYRQEGLLIQTQPTPDESVKYSPCLELFEGAKGKQGLLAVMDSQMRVPAASEDKFLSRMHKIYGPKGENENKAYSLPHPSQVREIFVVKHYASDVEYTVGSFLEKNNLSLPPEILELFTASKHVVVQAFTSLPSFSVEQAQKQNIRKKKNKKKKSKATSVASQFSIQMQELNETLSNTGCSYIRCIKPNPYLFFHPDVFALESLEAKTQQTNIQGSSNHKGRKSRIGSSDSGSTGLSRKSDPMRFHGKRARSMLHESKLKLATGVSKKNSMTQRKCFDANYVDLQLRNLGVYECVSVLKGGLSQRLQYSIFTDAFEAVIPIRTLMQQRFTDKNLTFHRKLYVATLLHWWDIPADAVKLGNKRVFFHSSKMELIDEMFNIAEKLRTPEHKEKLQRIFDKTYKRKRLRLLQAKARVIGGFLVRLKRHRMATKLQTVAKKFILRARLKHKQHSRLLLKNAIQIQSIARGYLARIHVSNLRIEREEELKKLQEEELKRLQEEEERALSVADIQSQDSLREEFKSTFEKSAYSRNALNSNLQNFVKRTSILAFAQSSSAEDANDVFRKDFYKSNVEEDNWGQVEEMLRNVDGPEGALQVFDDLNESEVAAISSDELEDKQLSRKTKVSVIDPGHKQSTKKKPSANSRRKYKELRRSVKRTRAVVEDAKDAVRLAQAKSGTVLPQVVKFTEYGEVPKDNPSRILDRKLRRSFESFLPEESKTSTSSKADARAKEKAITSEFTRKRMKDRLVRERTASIESKQSLLEEAQNKDTGNFVQRMAGRWNGIRGNKKGKQ